MSDTIEPSEPNDGDRDDRIDQDQCDHHNAVVEMVTYSKDSWWADAGRYVPDDSEDLPTLICPDCGFEEVQEPEQPDYEEAE